MNRTILGMVVIMALFGMLVLQFSVKPVKAQETIYINADGSVEGTTSIQTVDNVTYVLTGNIDGSITVQRDNITIDGNGYTLQGSGIGDGVDLSGRANVTLENITITGFEDGILVNSSSNNSINGNNIANNSNGIYLYSASSNTINENNITNNREGIYLLGFSNNNNVSKNSITANNSTGILLYSYSTYSIISGNNLTYNSNGLELSSSTYNIISGNNITNSGSGIWAESSANENNISGNNMANNYNGIYLSGSSNNSISGNNIEGNNFTGIYLGSSSNNSIFHNNFVNNTHQIYDNGWEMPGLGSINTWDDGYPSGGNFWSDYNGTDHYSGPYQNVTGSDGIGDTPYVIDSNNTDNYPLMTPVTTLPELPEPLILAIIILTTPLAIVIYKKRHAHL